MRVAIIDDEPLAREILESFLQKIPDVELVGCCKNAIEAFSLLSKQAVDLLLLDINLPEILGTEFLKTLKNPPLVIFTTAYSEYAIESYELNAVDYLLKPISFERFLLAINKAKEILAPTKIPTENPMDQQNLFVRSEGKWIKIDLTKLWLVEGLKDYLRLWINEERITIHNTMKNFEEQLAAFPNFIRIHKSFIVNLNFVEEVENNSIKINYKILSIGNTYKSNFITAFNHHKRHKMEKH
ncbi:MAG: LytR/AlgR family response regulator transcription factor [Bacteroidia bacterium]